MSKEILIPTKWSDVTLKEFIELSALDIDSFDSHIDYYVKMLGIFGNDNINDILEFVKLSDIADIVNQMSFMNKPPEEVDKKEVTIDGKVFRLIENMNEITVGEYVSIETLIEQGNLNSVSSIPAILSVILKPVNEVFNSSIVNERMELFKNKLSIEDVLGMSVFFDWRKVITFNYSALFGGQKEEEEGGFAMPKFSDRWKWFGIIERLASGDVTKFEEVYKITYLTALNTLSYWKERDEYQERLQKRQDMMNKHR